MPDSFPSVYDEQEFDYIPGSRVRTRPGQGPNEAIYDTIYDADGNRVSAKPANLGVLASQRRQRAHDKLVAERRAAKEEAARNRPPGGSSRGGSLISTLFLLAVFLPLLSSFLTGSESYTFHLSPYIVPPARKWWRTAPINPFRKPLRTFTPLQLSKYDGSNPKRPIYIAIDGDVYDVTAGRRMYGPGGSYHVMAGRDASRSFVSGCFQTHLTHDLRGFNADDLKALDSWKSFFAKHEKYMPVGRVLNPTIDPASPIPVPCDDDASSMGTKQKKSVPAGRGPPAGR